MWSLPSIHYYTDTVQTADTNWLNQLWWSHLRPSRQWLATTTFTLVSSIYCDSTITFTSTSWFSFLIDMCMLVDLLFTAGSNKTVQIHDMNTMQQVRTIYEPHNRTVNCIALNKVCTYWWKVKMHVFSGFFRVHLIQDYLVKHMTFFWPQQWLVEWNCGI